MFPKNGCLTRGRVHQQGIDGEPALDDGPDSFQTLRSELEQAQPEEGLDASALLKGIERVSPFGSRGRPALNRMPDVPACACGLQPSQYNKQK